MSHRLLDRDRAALRESEQIEPLETERVDDHGEIADPGIEIEVLAGPVGQARPSLVVPHDREVAREKLDLAPDRALPRVLEVGEPVRGPDEWRTVSVDGIGEADAVRCGDEANPRWLH